MTIINGKHRNDGGILAETILITSRTEPSNVPQVQDPCLYAELEAF
jgi:hypothetical protein